MGNRDFKGIWIPKEIWLSADLTLQEKLFLVEITSLDNEEGCYANNEYFATFFGLSKVRVSEVINSLVEKGFITSQIKACDGNKRILKTLANFSLRPSQTFIEDPHKLSFKNNNTSNNTANKTSNKATQKIENYIELNKEELAETFKDYPSIKVHAHKWLVYKFAQKEGYKETGWAKIMVKRIKETSLDFIKNKIDETIDNETGNKDYVYQNQIDAFKKTLPQIFAPSIPVKKQMTNEERRRA